MGKEKQPDQLMGNEALIQVTSTVLSKKRTVARKIKIRPFVTQTATVGVKFGSTIPTGDYGNVKIDVFISCPCYHEEIADVYKQVSGIADDLMSYETERVLGRQKK